MIGERLAQANEVVERHYRRAPELARTYGPRGRARCLEDALRHLDHLDVAVRMHSPSLFRDYTDWGASLLVAMGIPRAHLAENYRVLEEVVDERWEPGSARPAVELLREVRPRLAAAAAPLETHLDAGAPLADLAREYLAALLAGRRAEALARIRRALADGLDLRALYLQVFQPVQWEVGRLWQTRRIDVAQEHFCTAATQLALAQAYAQSLPDTATGPVAVVACVGEELHELGVRMVADFLELDGWNAHYLGANLPPASVLAALETRRAGLLCASTTLATHLFALKEIVDGVRERLPHVKVLVGGRPFALDPELVKSIGADAWAVDAEDAVRAARSLAGGRA